MITDCNENKPLSLWLCRQEIRCKTAFGDVLLYERVVHIPGTVVAGDVQTRYQNHEVADQDFLEILCSGVQQSLKEKT
jgi:hypothetical protein